MRQWVSRAGLSLALVLGGTVAISQGAGGPEASPGTSAAAGACASPDPAVTNPYAVTGFFMYPRIRPCGWRNELQKVHRLGGDTVVQFAPQLTPRGVDAQGRVLTFDKSGPDPAFTACTEGGQSCYRSALAAVRAVNPGNTIARVYAYATSDGFTDALMQCATVEKKIAVAVTEPDGFAHTRLYWRLLMPADATTATGCRTTATDYYLVLVAGEQNNSLGTLFAEAARFGMKVYAPMPAYPSPEGFNGGVDTAHDAAFTGFDVRVLRDYARQFASEPAFAGVYQTREYFLNPDFTAYLNVYRAQHRRVHTILPGRKIMASPYWAVWRYVGTTGEPYQYVTTPEDVTTAVTQIYQTGVDIIAPQDGRGGGATGLFWPYETTKQVDPRLVPKVGKRTYGQAFHYNSARLYQAAALARDRLIAQGQQVELWANIEAFEPGITATCAGTTLHRTDKPRLDQALTHLGTHTSKVISFAWDPLYTCPDGDPPLADQVAADNNRPVVSAAFSFTSNGRRGIAINGYQLGGSTVKLTWYDDHWQFHSGQIVVADSGWYDPEAGQRNDRLPDPMQTIWVPFAWTNMAADFYVHIEVANTSGKATTHRYSLAY